MRVYQGLYRALYDFTRQLRCIDFSPCSEEEVQLVLTHLHFARLFGGSQAKEWEVVQRRLPPPPPQKKKRQKTKGTLKRKTLKWSPATLSRPKMVPIKARMQNDDATTQTRMSEMSVSWHMPTPNAR